MLIFQIRLYIYEITETKGRRVSVHAVFTQTMSALFFVFTTSNNMFPFFTEGQKEWLIESSKLYYSETFWHCFRILLAINLRHLSSQLCCKLPLSSCALQESTTAKPVEVASSHNIRLRSESIQSIWYLATVCLTWPVTKPNRVVMLAYQCATQFCWYC